jgi:hypothetical protein
MSSETISPKDSPVLSLETTTTELAGLLPAVSELPFVENSRLQMVKGHLDCLLAENTAEQDLKLHTAYLGHLGASSLLAYLPKK